MPWRNSIPYTVRTFRQGSYNKKVWLSAIIGWDLESLDLLNGLALGCYQPSPEVFIVLLL